MAPKAAKPSKRSTGFSQVEVDNMLESIEKTLPVAGMEWDRVEREHEGRWPDKRRKKESLKRKFQSLYRRRVPTGEPHCPPDVRFAKRIQESIKEKVDMSDGDDSNEVEEDEDEEEDDDDDEDDDDNAADPVVNAADANHLFDNDNDEDSGDEGLTLPDLPALPALPSDTPIANARAPAIPVVPVPSVVPPYATPVARASKKKKKRKTDTLNQVVTKRGRN